MKIVGITGGIGSGKSTIAAYFNSEFDIPVYYADAEAKALMNTESLKKAITALLGEEAYQEGQLDRKYVASKVFNDDQLLEQLNGIVHPAVATHFKSWCQAQNAPYVLKEAAILFENGTADALDAVILITAPKQLRIDRVLKRDQFYPATRATKNLVWIQHRNRVNQRVNASAQNIKLWCDSSNS